MTEKIKIVRPLASYLPPFPPTLDWDVENEMRNKEWYWNYIFRENKELMLNAESIFAKFKSEHDN